MTIGGTIALAATLYLVIGIAPLMLKSVVRPDMFNNPILAQKVFDIAFYWLLWPYTVFELLVGFTDLLRKLRSQ